MILPFAIPRWAADLAAVVIVVGLSATGGFMMGMRWKAADVHELVESAYADRLATASEANAEQEKTIRGLQEALLVAKAAETGLRESADRAERIARTRDQWRIDERNQNPECAAWLAVANPCRLQPVGP
jgi:hypothetical protein